MNNSNYKIKVANKEHMEAGQHFADKELNIFLKTLPKEDVKKFNAVRKAEKILSDAGVYAFIFPLLKTKNKNGDYKDAVYQFNTAIKLAEFDENEKVTEKHSDNFQKLNTSFITTFFNHYLLMGQHKGDPESFISFIAGNQRYFINYFEEKEKE